jgi:hypothetical protein
MSHYRTGTIALTNGSAAVVGTGTDFINGAAIGECVQAPDGKLYEILTIASATSLTLGSVYLGATASGQAYSIVPTQSYIRELAAQAAALVNSYSSILTTALTTAATAKATPIDADSIGLKDSVTGFARLLTWANLKATIVSYFQSVGLNSTAIGSTTPSTGAFTTLSASGLLTGNSAQFTGAASPASGSGTEVFYSGGSGYVQSYNRTGSAYTPLFLTGSTINLYPNGASIGAAVVSSNGLAVTGAISGTTNLLLNGATSTVAFGASSTEQIYRSGTTLNLMTNSVTQATLDANGNFGVKATPHTGWTPANACFIALGGLGGNGLVGTGAGSTAPSISLVTNGYYNVGWKYHSSSSQTGAGLYNIENGSHRWYIDNGTPTAGNTIPGFATPLMTLNDSGVLDVGGGTGGGAFINPSNGITGQTQLQVTHSAASTSGSAFQVFVYNAGIIGSITQSGTTAVAYNTTSDHRLKTNVRDANAARFMDIQFRDFEWIDGRHDCGVIAHEFQLVYPDLVLGDKDATEVRTVEITPAVPAVLDAEGVEVTPAVASVTEQQTFPVYQQVNYMGLIGRMGTRVQSLQRTVDAQAAMIEALAARLTAAGIA